MSPTASARDLPHRGIYWSGNIEMNTMTHISKSFEFRQKGEQSKCLIISNLHDTRVRNFKALAQNLF